MRLLGTDKAAMAAGISTVYLRKLLAQGKFPRPAETMGGSFFWTLDQIKQWRDLWNALQQGKK